jgi:succinate dehydrogenase / fumarate reductase cytochrome b subunit
VVHLDGNLLLYVGADAYDEYAHKLHEQAALLVVAEVGLLALFVAHLYLAVRTTVDWRAARQVQYAVKRSKITEGRLSAIAPEAWMFASGAVILGFVLLHLADFRFQLRPDVDYAGKSPFEKAATILSNPVSAGVYAVAMLFLWAHLGHGVQSAFQTLGLNHPKWRGALRCAGVLFAALVALGFLSFPVWALFRSAGSH